jgi:hypothetical protein
MKAFHYARPNQSGFCQVIRQNGMVASDGEVVINFLKSPVVADALARELNAGDWRNGRGAATPGPRETEAA